VLITEAFQMSATEVTVGQYRQFDPKHRGRHEDDAVTEVSWKEAVAFCEWLSKKEGTTDRLPPRSSFTSLTSQGSLSPSVL
jgi:sulfatase modifying factor 1